MVEVLVGGDDQRQLRGLLADQVNQQSWIIGGIDQQRFACRCNHEGGGPALHVHPVYVERTFGMKKGSSEQEQE